MVYTQMVWLVMIVVAVLMISSCDSRAHHHPDTLPHATHSLHASTTSLFTAAESMNGEVISRPIRSAVKSRRRSFQKRSISGPSCKGVYSRNMWSQLSQACLDCQNLFREKNMASKCSEGCYHNDTPTCTSHHYSNSLTQVGVIVEVDLVELSPPVPSFLTTPR
ncbi:hypothetical protein Pcinc_008494 [Petrolisthes cinctipes]|uniref:Uncharacterized protein n=1 Tax=Petrolisthes cinctipes TaxID=88211 RepID=A0AAE1KVR5_PETCI|nr:hypothetical protein Pcinc_008494 [Petrolisthes cinctipes]